MDISPVPGLFHHCVIVTYVFVFNFLWMLYLWLLHFVFVFHTICFLVALHHGSLLMHMSCILLFMHIHNGGLTYLCLNYFSHALKLVYLFLVDQYIMFISILQFFLMFITLRGYLHLKGPII